MRNIALLAHVDAGKTTLTEQLLYCCGATRILGHVDDGTTVTDALPIERARGISIRAACARMRWHDTWIQLIDTPGHVDFTAQVEHALWALDGAVLLVSAVDGVQAHTQLLFESLRAQRIPTLIFLTKADRPSADPAAACQSIAQQLTPDLLSVPTALFAGEAPDPRLSEALAERDETLLECFLQQGTLTSAQSLAGLGRLTQACALYPILAGSGLTGEGVPALLDAICTLLPAPSGACDAALCGVVFGISQDRMMGRGAHVRLYQGKISVRDTVPIGAETYKVTQIRRLATGQAVENLMQLCAGELGILYGLSNCRVGAIIGDASALPRRIRPGELMTPLLQVQALPAQPTQIPALYAALRALEAEDPLLQVEWAAQTRQLHVRVMGAIQLEILPTLLAERFGLTVAFGEPAVIYRETPAREAVGFYAYTMPKPCWAVLRFHLYPLPRGSGVAYECALPPSRLPTRYRRQIAQTLPLALRQGRLGWEVTDCRIVLEDGEDHPIHTHPLDFALCTPIALMDGLRNAGSTLLEPLLHIRFTLQNAQAGRLLSDITAMRGTVEGLQSHADHTTVEATIPAAASQHYPMAFAALTGGHGVMVSRLAGYAPCPIELGATAPRRDVDPLDTARYILAMRNALAADIQ